jgi:hypothetical protein
MYADWRGSATTIDAKKKDRGLEPPKQERPMAATGSPGCRKEKAASAGLFLSTAIDNRRLSAMTCQSSPSGPRPKADVQNAARPATGLGMHFAAMGHAW